MHEAWTEMFTPFCIYHIVYFSPDERIYDQTTLYCNIFFEEYTSS